MPEQPPRHRRSIVTHSMAGVLIVLVAGGTLVWWSLGTRIAGAVVATGSVAVDGGPKRVQHPEGGVVAAILVRDEDQVRAGDALVRLDGTTLQASYDLILGQQRDAHARELRLAAEAAARSRMGAPGPLPAGIAGDEFDRLLALQAELFDAHAASLRGQRERIAEQIVQLERKAEGLQAELAADEAQQALVAAEIDDQQRLLGEKLVSAGRSNDLRRVAAQLRGEAGRIAAAIAETRATVAERQAMLVQLDDDQRVQAIRELQAVRAELAQLAQQRIGLADRLDRLVIRAPQSGTVDASTVVTVGGVVGAGETLMMVVPALHEAVVDLRVSPLDIDKVYAAQDVIVRFTGIDARATPDLAARIKSVAPDLTTDPRSGAQYYLARVMLEPAELDRLPGGRDHLVPGMPAEAFIRTGDRTVLAYLVKPLLDQLARVFRED
ncbi:MAG: HlyD family type I secretion periplasmic adaptor subunit [Devosia sp.]|nr:HlyD family type I secretion periplasmic adaptor subunit [Devosia sp.]